MSTPFFIIAKGFGLGFAIAAVVGPIGILCIRRSITDGFVVGFATGFGAAFADAFYGGIAAFGLSMITDFLLRFSFFLYVVGGGYLIYLGITTAMSKPTLAARTGSGVGLLMVTASTFLLTLTSPVTILAFLSLFVGLGIGTTDIFSAMQLVLGVFLGSTMWWLVLSSFGAFLGSKMNVTVLSWVNRVSGFVIVFFGLVFLVRVFW